MNFKLYSTKSVSDKEAKEHLSHYLSEAQELRPEMDHLLQVCQLFVHCWEDSLISLYSKTSDNLLQEDLVPDRFVVYGEDYKNFRESMAKTVLSGTNRELTKSAYRPKPFAIQLLNNTQGAAGLIGVRVAPGRSALEQNLAELFIHTTAVLQCLNQMTVCEPLRLLMDSPANIVWYN
ncbi:hypothetical protein OS493_040505 [Desmophyllum pertusum]|uniref:Uncharacterized protein n=1 Tax=Desmophyllum pertusum TaxID=174260 RepID=A0A9W9YWW3_9CNID|nr:hypothetical protein OS493_040505 [Desmophyllum pertusum]